jgi:hypothetical protein
LRLISGWKWAEKPLDSMLTIPVELHEAVMELSPDERRDRAKPSIYKLSFWLHDLASPAQIANAHRSRFQFAICDA